MAQAQVDTTTTMAQAAGDSTMSHATTTEGSNRIRWAEEVDDEEDQLHHLRSRLSLTVKEEKVILKEVPKDVLTILHKEFASEYYDPTTEKVEEKKPEVKRDRKGRVRLSLNTPIDDQLPTTVSEIRKKITFKGVLAGFKVTKGPQGDQGPQSCKDEYDFWYTFYIEVFGEPKVECNGSDRKVTLRMVHGSINAKYAAKYRLGDIGTFILNNVELKKGYQDENDYGKAFVSLNSVPDAFWPENWGPATGQWNDQDRKAFGVKLAQKHFLQYQSEVQWLDESYIQENRAYLSEPIMMQHQVFMNYDLMRQNTLDGKPLSSAKLAVHTWCTTQTAKQPKTAFDKNSLFGSAACPAPVLLVNDERPKMSRSSFGSRATVVEDDDGIVTFSRTKFASKEVNSEKSKSDTDANFTRENFGSGNESTMAANLAHLKGSGKKDAKVVKPATPTRSPSPPELPPRGLVRDGEIFKFALDIAPESFVVDQVSSSGVPFFKPLKKKVTGINYSTTETDSKKFTAKEYLWFDKTGLSDSIRKEPGGEAALELYTRNLRLNIGDQIEGRLIWNVQARNHAGAWNIYPVVPELETQTFKSDPENIPIRGGMLATRLWETFGKSVPEPADIEKETESVPKSADVDKETESVPELIQTVNIGTETDSVPETADVGTETDSVPETADIGTETDPVSKTADVGTETDPVPETVVVSADPISVPESGDIGAETDPVPEAVVPEAADDSYKIIQILNEFLELFESSISNVDLTKFVLDNMHWMKYENYEWIYPYMPTKMWTRLIFVLLEGCSHLKIEYPENCIEMVNYIEPARTVKETAELLTFYLVDKCLSDKIVKMMFSLMQTLWQNKLDREIFEKEESELVEIQEQRLTELSVSEISDSDILDMKSENQEEDRLTFLFDEKPLVDISRLNIPQEPKVESTSHSDEDPLVGALHINKLPKKVLLTGGNDQMMWGIVPHDDPTNLRMVSLQSEDMKYYNRFHSLDWDPVDVHTGGIDDGKANIFDCCDASKSWKELPLSEVFQLVTQKRYNILTLDGSSLPSQKTEPMTLLCLKDEFQQPGASRTSYSGVKPVWQCGLCDGVTECMHAHCNSCGFVYRFDHEVDGTIKNDTLVQLKDWTRDISGISWNDFGEALKPSYEEQCQWIFRRHSSDFFKSLSIDCRGALLNAAKRSLMAQSNANKQITVLKKVVCDSINVFIVDGVEIGFLKPTKLDRDVRCALTSVLISPNIAVYNQEKQKKIDNINLRHFDCILSKAAHGSGLS